LSCGAGISGLATVTGDFSGVESHDDAGQTRIGILAWHRRIASVAAEPRVSSDLRAVRVNCQVHDADLRDSDGMTAATAGSVAAVAAVATVAAGTSRMDSVGPTEALSSSTRQTALPAWFSLTASAPMTAISGSNSNIMECNACTPHRESDTGSARLPTFSTATATATCTAGPPACAARGCNAADHGLAERSTTATAALTWKPGRTIPPVAAEDEARFRDPVVFGWRYRRSVLTAVALNTIRTASAYGRGFPDASAPVPWRIKIRKGQTIPAIAGHELASIPTRSTY